METSLEEQKEQLMREGYVIVRDIIPPDELERLRESVDTIIDKAPPSSRVTVTEWVDKQTANAVEFYFDDRTLDFSRKLMEAPDVAPLGMWVLCHSGTGWHRDIHPIDMAPLDGLQEDIRLNGPPYLQWNLALYDDSYLHVIPRSHLRRNTEAESKMERRMGVVPLPGEITVDLKAGDGVVYINGILHSATPNSDDRSGEHFILDTNHLVPKDSRIFSCPDTMGVEFVGHLSPGAAEKCHHFEALHAKRHNDIAFTLRAILEKDADTFTEGLHRIHRSEHARMTTLSSPVKDCLLDSQIQRFRLRGIYQWSLPPTHGRPFYPRRIGTTLAAIRCPRSQVAIGYEAVRTAVSEWSDEVFLFRHASRFRR